MTDDARMDDELDADLELSEDDAANVTGGVGVDRTLAMLNHARKHVADRSAVSLNREQPQQQAPPPPPQNITTLPPMTRPKPPSGRT